MNREQRRREQRGGISAQPLQTTGTLSISYGHNGYQVVVQITRKVDNLVLGEQQVDGMITGLQTAKAALIAHKAAAAAQGGPGHG